MCLVSFEFRRVFRNIVDPSLPGSVFNNLTFLFDGKVTSQPITFPSHGNRIGLEWRATNLMAREEVQRTNSKVRSYQRTTNENLRNKQTIDTRHHLQFSEDSQVTKTCQRKIVHRFNNLISNTQKNVILYISSRELRRLFE